jgi:hypothetical protein
MAPLVLCPYSADFSFQQNVNKESEETLETENIFMEILKILRKEVIANVFLHQKMES